MKYLKSTTQKSYIFNGRKIPECVTADNAVLALNDEDYTTFTKTSVIKSLINSGAIIVMDKAPTSPTAQVKSLTGRNAEQALEITRLNETIKELNTKLEAAGNNTEVETLKAALEKQRNDDIAEIKQLQAEKDAEIAELKKQLEKAHKKASKEAE